MNSFTKSSAVDIFLLIVALTGIPQPVYCTVSSSQRVVCSSDPNTQCKEVSCVTVDLNECIELSEISEIGIAFIKIATTFEGDAFDFSIFSDRNCRHELVELQFSENTCSTLALFDALIDIVILRSCPIAACPKRPLGAAQNSTLSTQGSTTSSPVTKHHVRTTTSTLFHTTSSFLNPEAHKVTTLLSSQTGDESVSSVMVSTTKNEASIPNSHEEIITVCIFERRTDCNLRRSTECVQSDLDVCRVATGLALMQQFGVREAYIRITPEILGSLYRIRFFQNDICTAALPISLEASVDACVSANVPLVGHVADVELFFECPLLSDESICQILPLSDGRTDNNSNGKERDGAHTIVIEITSDQSNLAQISLAEIKNAVSFAIEEIGVSSSIVSIDVAFTDDFGSAAQVWTQFMSESAAKDFESVVMANGLNISIQHVVLQYQVVVEEVSSSSNGSSPYHFTFCVYAI